jgi:hypothetical protein
MGGDIVGATPLAARCATLSRLALLSILFAWAMTDTYKEKRKKPRERAGVATHWPPALASEGRRPGEPGPTLGELSVVEKAEASAHKQ